MILLVIPISRPEILRCAQDDSQGSCHPERSEGSLARICPATLPHMAWRTSGESRDHLGKRRRPWNISPFDARVHTAIQMKQVKQVKQMKQVKQTSRKMH